MVIARPDVTLLYGKICDITETGDVTIVRIDAGGNVMVDLEFSTRYIQKMKPKIGGKCCCTALELPEFFILADGGVFQESEIKTKGLSMIYSGTMFVKGQKLFKNLELVYGTVVRSENKERYNEYLVTYRSGKTNTTKIIKNYGNKKVKEGQKYLFVQETTNEENGPFWATKII